VTAPTSTALRDGTIGRQSAFCSLVGDPFGRDLAYLFRLVAAHKIDPQLAGELPWDQMPAALERLRNRDVAGSSPSRSAVSAGRCSNTDESPTIFEPGLKTYWITAWRLSRRWT